MKQKFIIAFLMLFITGNVYATQVSNLIFPISYFIDHVEQLKQINANLSNHRKTSIVAPSGAGKTQLARMYAWQNKDKYDIIWFIDCNLDINQEFVKLSKTINNHHSNKLISEDKMNAKIEVMEYLKTKDKWLLVFDNLHPGHNVKVKDIIEWDNNGHIIFASQESHLLPVIIKSIKFKTKDAKALAKTILNDGRYADFLSEQFINNPILIVNGAQIINSYPGLTQDEYEKIINENTDHVRANLNLSMSHLSDSAKSLLFKIALINNQQFSREFLNMISGNKDISDDIVQLTRFVLIDCINSNPENPIYEMHDLFANKVSAINGRKGNNMVLEEMVDNILYNISNEVHKAHILITSDTLHDNLYVILKNAEHFKLAPYKILGLRRHLFATYMHLHDHANSNEMNQWYDSYFKNYIKPFPSIQDQLNHARFLSTLSCYYRIALGNDLKALETLKQYQKIIDKVHGYYDLKFSGMYHFAQSNTSLGYLEEANNYINQMDEMLLSKKVDNSERGFMHLAKAKLYYYQGKYLLALKEVEQDIAISKQYGIKSNDLIFTSTYILKAQILNALERSNDAKEQTLFLYDMHIASKPDTHEIFGKIYNELAVAELNLLKQEKALNLINKAINIFLVNQLRIPKQLQDQDLIFDQDLALSYTIRGNILSKLNRFEEAIVDYRRAQKIYYNAYNNRTGNMVHVARLYIAGARAAYLMNNEGYFKDFIEALLNEFGSNNMYIEEIRNMNKKFKIKT